MLKRPSGPSQRRLRGAERLLPYAALCAAALCVSVGAPARLDAQSGPSAAPAAPSPLEGRFVRDSVASDDVTAAIERAVREMNALTRPIGRRRLQATNRPPTDVRFTLTADSIIIAYAGQPEVRARRNGAPRPWRNAAGEEFTVRVMVAQDPDGGVSVRQSFEAEDGRRQNLWRVDARGAQLQLEVTVSSPRLPTPLRYRQVFRPAR